MASVMWERDIADAYDQTTAPMFERSVVGPTVDFLADVARGGAVLEFAIGTGRVALPLAARGLRVHGIELSPHMVERLRSKPGAATVDVTIGDMTTTTRHRVVRRRLPRVQHDHERHHASRTGRRVPQRRRAPRTGRLFRRRGGRAAAPPAASWRGRSGVRDRGRSRRHRDLRRPRRSGAWSHHWMSVDGRLVRHSAPYRYVWPSELDLMAQLAGLRLRERWGTWSREPFTSESTSQVVVYEHATMPR